MLVNRGGPILVKADIAQLFAQLILGVAFVRGRWLVDLAISGRGGFRPSGGESEAGVEQGIGPDGQARA